MASRLMADAKRHPELDGLESVKAGLEASIKAREARKPLAGDDVEGLKQVLKNEQRYLAEVNERIAEINGAEKPRAAVTSTK